MDMNTVIRTTSGVEEKNGDEPTSYGGTFGDWNVESNINASARATRWKVE
jgi:hypothetical protein